MLTRAKAFVVDLVAYGYKQDYEDLVPFAFISLATTLALLLVGLVIQKEFLS